MMSNHGLIIENMDLSRIQLAVQHFSISSTYLNPCISV